MAHRMKSVADVLETGVWEAKTRKGRNLEGEKGCVSGLGTMMMVKEARSDGLMQGNTSSDQLTRLAKCLCL